MLTDPWMFGGTRATGYFSYDDETQTVSNWNVDVGYDVVGLTFPPLSFLELRPIGGVAWAKRKHPVPQRAT